MSNIFRDSEFLGKNNGKKWSWIWTFLFENCLKLPRKKKVFCSLFFTFEVPLNGLFAPTSQSKMSNIFREADSLGKSNGKKWSNIWNFLFGSGLKSQRKKKFFLLILHYKTWWKPRFPMYYRVFGYSWTTLLWHRCYYAHRSRDALSPVCGIFIKVTKIYLVFTLTQSWNMDK